MGSGFKNFGAEVLTSNDVDGYLMRQTTMTFATSAARDSALSGFLDEGMVAYLEDAPNRFTYYDGAAWQTSGSEWTTWSPSYANITVGNGTVVARYQFSAPRTITAKWNFTLGSTSSVGASSATVSLPTSAVYTWELNHGQAYYHDVGTSIFYGRTTSSTAANVAFVVNGSAGTYVNDGTNVTTTTPFTWVTGDIMSFSVTYEV